MDITCDTILGKINALPLKDMEASLLTRAILDRARELGLNVDLISQAIDLSAYAHRAQTRANRGPMPRTHYVEHVLRVALRVIRYGCTDQDVIIAAILHDTAEDHALQLAAEFGGYPKAGVAPSEAMARALVLESYWKTFSPEVARVVHSLSNPISAPGLTREQKTDEYVQHVLEAITDPKVFAVKFSDFADNALSLHYNLGGPNAKMVPRLATKYLPLVPVFTERITHADIRELVGADGVRQMTGAIGRNRLAELSGI